MKVVRLYDDSGIFSQKFVVLWVIVTRRYIVDLFLNCKGRDNCSYSSPVLLNRAELISSLGVEYRRRKLDVTVHFPWDPRNGFCLFVFSVIP